jgi:hypothetical protein
LSVFRQAAERVAVQPFIWLGLGCYAVGVAVWIPALSRVAVNLAGPFLSLATWSMTRS